MKNFLNVLFAIVGTLFAVLALVELLPNGLWLYLGMLVLGVQLMTMAIRSSIE